MNDIVQSKSISNQYRKDEINLKDLFVTLWQGRIYIVLMTVVAFLLGASHALTSQEWWTARALVTQPERSDYTEYELSTRELSLVMGGEANISNYFNPDQLISQFLVSFNSDSVKRQFLLQNSTFIDFYRGSSDKEISVESATLGWLSKISAESINKEDSEGLFELRFQSISSESSLQQLRSYIDFVQLQAINKIYENLNAEKRLVSKALSIKLSLLERDAKDFIALELERNKSAYRIAKAASIGKPLLDFQSKDYYSVALGADAINAKVLELEGLSDLSIVRPKIAQLRTQLEALEAIDLAPQKMQMFRLVGDLVKPLRRDKPKRFVIVVLATLLGAILGVFIVLIRSFVKSS